MSPDQHATDPQDTNTQPTWQPPHPETHNAMQPQTPQQAQTDFTPLDTSQPSAPAFTPTDTPAPQPFVPTQQPTPPQMTPLSPASPGPSLVPTPGYPTQPHVPYASDQKKKLILIGSTAVAICIIGVIGYFLFFNKGNNPLSSITDAVTGNSDTISRSDGALDVSHLIDTGSSIKSQDIKARLNQQVNLSNGVSYMVTKVERNFVSTSPLLKAGKNKELVKVSVVFGNRDKSNSNYVGTTFVKLINSAGGLVTAEFTTSDDFSDAYEATDIAPGKQISGALVYEVDKGEAIKGFSTKDQYENISTKEKVDLISEVDL